MDEQDDGPQAIDRHVSVHGHDVWVRERVPGRPSEDPPLVLLHGFGASSFSFHQVLDPLGHARRTIAFDRTGFGRTAGVPLTAGDEPRTGPYSMTAAVGQTIGLLDALEIDRAVLVGNSAGGTVALRVALAHPDRVAALVLLDAAVRDDDGPPHLVVRFARTNVGQRVGVAALDRAFRFGSTRPGRRFARRVLGGAFADRSLADDATVAGYLEPLARDRQGATTLWEMTKAFRPADVEDRASLIEIATLVVGGAESRVVPIEVTRKLVKTMPRAIYVELPNCGHVPQEEQPDEVVAEILAFIGAGSL